MTSEHTAPGEHLLLFSFLTLLPPASGRGTISRPQTRLPNRSRQASYTGRADRTAVPWGMHHPDYRAFAQIFGSDVDGAHAAPVIREAAVRASVVPVDRLMPLTAVRARLHGVGRVDLFDRHAPQLRLVPKHVAKRRVGLLMKLPACFCAASIPAVSHVANHQRLASSLVEMRDQPCGLLVQYVGQQKYFCCPTADGGRRTFRQRTSSVVGRPSSLLATELTNFFGPTYIPNLVPDIAKLLPFPPLAPIRPGEPIFKSHRQLPSMGNGRHRTRPSVTLKIAPASRASR